jgi:hypothetical protein
MDQKKIYVVAFVTLFIVAVLIFSYYKFFYIRSCDNIECFQNSFQTCSRAYWLNDISEDATWRYDVVKRVKSECEVEVTLLQAKKGDLALEKLRGQSMVCTLPYAVFSYPEKDLRLCTGKLKEELQGILIEKLYQYIVPNTKQLNQELAILSK